MKHIIPGSSQTFLYIATDNAYYCFLQAQIIKALKEHDQKTRHIIVPCFGIRYHESDASKKLPRTLKRVQISWREKAKEQARAIQSERHLKHFLGNQLCNEIELVRQESWLKWLIKEKFNLTIKTTCQKGGRKHDETQSIEGILCRDLCADSYMRYKPDTSTDTNDEFYSKTSTRAAALIRFYKELISRYKPAIVIGTDTTYVHHGIPHRVAAQANVPTISLAGLEESFKLNLNQKKYSLSRLSQPSYCRDYQNYTPAKDSEIPEEIYKRALKSLSRRVENIYDGTFTYMNRGLERTSESKKSCKGRVLIMLHDFFDASHIYRWKIFTDFYEWADCTISYCLENNIPVAIKPHPAQIEESEKVVKRLQEIYPGGEEILWVDKSQKNSTLFSSEPALLVSMYGSVAAEATYAGVPVLLAGDHPGINFNIGYSAKNKEQYFKYLKNYRQAMKGRTEEAISFTAQHYYNNFAKKYDSLKSRISQDEDKWNYYSNYKSPEVIEYSQEFKVDLIKKLQDRSLLM